MPSVLPWANFGLSLNSFSPRCLNAGMTIEVALVGKLLLFRQILNVGRWRLDAVCLMVNGECWKLNTGSDSECWVLQAGFWMLDVEC